MVCVELSADCFFLCICSVRTVYFSLDLLSNHFPEVNNVVLAFCLLISFFFTGSAIWRSADTGNLLMKGGLLLRPNCMGGQTTQTLAQAPVGLGRLSF